MGIPLAAGGNSGKAPARDRVEGDVLSGKDAEGGEEGEDEGTANIFI